MGEGKDLRKAECPYCGRSLPKVPAKKTKCAHCGEDMYVRTRPQDGARVIATLLRRKAPGPALIVATT